MKTISQGIDVIINGPAYFTANYHLNSFWALVIVIGAFFAELVVGYVLVLLLVTLVRYLPALGAGLLRFLGMGPLDDMRVFLELTFPADTDKSAFATEQLHILLRAQPPHASLWQRLAGRKLLHSLEIVSTRDEGIRYIMVVSTGEVAYVQRSLRAYAPDIKIRKVNDYFASPSSGIRDAAELTLASDFILPLRGHPLLEEHDPIAYLMGQMTKLETGEMTAFQLVVAPVFTATHHRVTRRVNAIRHRLALRKEVSSLLVPQRTPLGSLLWLAWFPPVWFVTTTITFFTTTVAATMRIVLPDGDGSGEVHVEDNPYELELEETIKGKLDQPLFEVSIRLLVDSPHAADVQAKLRALVASLQPLAGSFQSVRIRQDFPGSSAHSRRLDRFAERRLSSHYFSQQTIVSSSELADLYHFPHTGVTKTEGLIKSRSRELPTPLSIKRSDARLDVIVGVNTHGGDRQPIGMSLKQRQTHTYVIGKTGMGKTTMLKSMIYQDMVSGNGLAVIDPHGDLFQELLGMVPEHRHEDVVVFDPSDRDWPLGLNILDPGIEFASDDDKHEWITSMVIAVFAKLADKGFWGPRMEHILRNATMTALQLPRPSLYTLQRLLTDQAYQRKVARTLKDPVLKQFWDKEFRLLGTMQLASATAPLTHRLGHFMTTKLSRHILLQEKTTLRVADIMNEGKILLVNVAKGDIGEDQSTFFGTIVTSLVWMAAYQRTKLLESQRRDFFVYVDEFQNFATPQFSEITSEGRKFHVALIVSHQNIAQIENKDLVKVIASNAGTIICLKVGPEDEAFILPYMRPEVEKGDMVHLAPYHFYMKTTNDISEEAFSGQTVPGEEGGTSATRSAVIASSRARYGTARKEAEAYVGELFKEAESPTRSRSVVVDRKPGEVTESRRMTKNTKL